MNTVSPKGKFIRGTLYIVLISLFVFWGVVFGPNNAKYFSVLYLAAGIGLLAYRIPFALTKKAWPFFLLLGVNVIALLLHSDDTASIINICTLVLSYLVLYYLVVAGVRYLGEDKFEKAVFRCVQYGLVISLLLSPALTLLKWPYAPSYFPWDALFSDKRFLLVIGNMGLGKDVGHSDAMWLMAFIAVIMVKEIVGRNGRFGKLLRFAALLLLVWALVETKSRTALLFVAVIFLSWLVYAGLLSRRLYALVPIVATLVFYVSILNPLYQRDVENTAIAMQRVIPSLRILSVSPGGMSPYAGRDVLNLALISTFLKHPWSGAGDSAPILVLGVNRDGSVNYDQYRFASTESMFRMLVKYGVLYFGALLLFLLVPLLRAFSGYYKDDVFVISVCSIVLLSGINGNIFENLYDISALFAVLILTFLVVPKYAKARSLRAAASPGVLSGFAGIGAFTTETHLENSAYIRQRAS